MKNNLKEAIKKYREKPGTLHGPYNKYSASYGITLPSLNRNNWFLYTKTGIYVIVQFESQPNRFIVEQSYPTIERKTLKALISYLMKLKKKLILCT